MTHMLLLHLTALLSVIDLCPLLSCPAWKWVCAAVMNVWTLAFIEVVTVATQAHHWRYNCLPEDLHALDFKPHVSTFDACLSCMSWSNMHVHMLPLHVRNEYACPHDTTPPCPDVKTHVWNLMFHNCMSNMHSEKNCMSTRYLFVKLHVHVAKCMSQNCHYANCMSNMQFKSELHVHKLQFFMMYVCMQVS